LYLPPVVARYPRGIEFVERFTVVVALLEDRIPAEASLRAFENQEFKEHTVVVNGLAPFFIVIMNGQFVVRPRTTNSFVRAH
jgi:hypothetical protein